MRERVGTAPQELDLWRRRVLPVLRGTVLDVGAGSGPAASYLSPDVQWIALEPTPSRRLVQAARARPGSRVLAASAQDIPLAEGSVNAVVCSMVLCSVPDPDGALAQIRRVLHPGGHVVLFEHVAAAPGSAASRLQRLIAPVTRVLDHGCDPSRDTELAVRRAGFAEVSLCRIRTGGTFGWLAPVLTGRAVR